MDYELLDCFTSPFGEGHHDHRIEAENSRAGDALRGMPARGSDVPSAKAKADDCPPFDAIAAFGRSLTPAMRTECRERAEKRAFAYLGDLSDPCICGEAQLLIEAARRGVGRAPASCFDRLGDM